MESSSGSGREEEETSISSSGEMVRRNEWEKSVSKMLESEEVGLVSEVGMKPEWEREEEEEEVGKPEEEEEEDLDWFVSTSSSCSFDPTTTMADSVAYSPGTTVGDERPERWVRGIGRARKGQEVVEVRRGKRIQSDTIRRLS